MDANNLLFCSLCLFSTALFAGETNKATEFNALDTSGNGYVTVNEAKDNIELLRKWTDVDKNTDGYIDFVEFSAFEIPPAIELPGTFEPIVEEDDPHLGSAPTE